MHPTTYVQAIGLGSLQGAAELFPVSSLGHARTSEERIATELGGKVRGDEEPQEDVVLLVDVPAEQPRRDHAVSVRFFVRYFETNRLTPFASYCLAAGAVFTVAIAVT